VDEAARGYTTKGPGALKAAAAAAKKDPPIGKEGSNRNRHISDIRQLVSAIDPRKPIDPDHHAKILSKLDKLKEEVEQVDEKYMGFKAVEKAVAAKGARNPAAVAAYIGRKKYGKEKFQAMAAAGKKANEEVALDEADIKSKPVLHKGKEIGETGIDTEASAGGGKWYAKHHKTGMNTAGFDSRKEAESEVRAAHGLDEEAEGSVPTTPKQKALAAHHGDKTRITYGDVIKARLKSAAAKKMGK
jgi:hypothetical protein